MGYEYEELSAKAIEDFKILFDARAKKIKQLFFAFLKLYLSIITIIGKTNIQEILKTKYFRFFFQEFRGKPMKKFPFIVFYTIDEEQKVIFIKAVFDANQDDQKYTNIK